MVKIKKFLLGKKDQAVKIVAPKIVTAFANIIRMGPRMIFRSAVELMRANLITRLLSCLTLLGIDVYDLAKRRISKTQFVKNLILSVLLIVSGTIGWDLGGRWIVLEFAGVFADIVGGIIGAAILTTVSNLILDKASGKLVETDAQKMWKILDPHIAALNEEEQEWARNHVTASCLKKMYASNDRDKYARELIEKLKNHEEVGGVLRAEYHAQKGCIPRRA